MRRLIPALLAAMFLASPALAVDPEAFLTNTTELRKLLKLNGINPNRILWNDLEEACVVLKEPGNALDYNRCRFEKARDQVLFADDSTICRDESIAIYPNTKQRNTAETVISQTGSETSSIAVASSGSSIQDIRANRRYAFDQCMQEKGWRNAHNYLVGQSR